jgi:6-phosphofructo-2-kinase/fructose-2,6-biphosphatase 2
MAPSVPSRKITDNLTRAAGVLQDMQAQGEKLNLRNNMPASPPALFGAGGPMSVIFAIIVFIGRSVLNTTKAQAVR